MLHVFLVQKLHHSTYLPFNIWMFLSPIIFMVYGNTGLKFEQAYLILHVNNNSKLFDNNERLTEIWIRAI